MSNEPQDFEVFSVVTRWARTNAGLKIEDIAKKFSTFW